VTQADAEAFKERHRLHYFTEVSAKTGQGIKEVVDHVAKTLYHINKENLSSFKES
jgi:translation initiation factor IF-2